MKVLMCFLLAVYGIDAFIRLFYLWENNYPRVEKETAIKDSVTFIINIVFFIWIAIETLSLFK